MNTSTTIIAMILIATFSLTVFAQDRTTLEPTGTVSTFTYTGFPRYGVVVTPSDVTDLVEPGYVRADAAGSVRAACEGSGSANHITVQLAAGEFFPCMVIRVYDTNTDAITLHVFY